MRRRTALFILAAGIPLVSGMAVFVYLARSGEVHIDIANHTDEKVSRGTIIAFGQSYSFQDVAVGNSAHVDFPARGEGGYRVTVEFESGSKLSSDEMGYITSGPITIYNTVEIKDGKIVIVDTASQ